MSWAALLAALLAALAAAEAAGRALGLHRPVLYEKTSYGYRAVPGQELRRLGRRIAYNAQGLRSEPLAPPGRPRVLCVGDSITNGGALTAQEETYPYLLEGTLGGEAQALNASAGGWALENELGWLRAHGALDAAVVVLNVASHDLVQPFAPPEVVGTQRQFPERSPRLALAALLARVLPGEPDPGAAVFTPGTADLERSLATLRAMVREVRARGAAPVVVLIEQAPGLEPADAFWRGAKQRLRSLLAEERVPLVQPRLLAEDFRDAVHPNPRGNAVLAAAVAPEVRRALNPLK